MEHDGWTIATVLRHIESLLMEMDRRYQERFDSQEEALKIAVQGKTERQATILGIAAILASSAVAYIVYHH